MIESLLWIVLWINLSWFNYNEFYENILFEDYKKEFIWKKLTYGAGCVWSYTKCKSNRFDCGWLIKKILLENDIIKQNQLSKRNSRCIYESWTPKKINDVDPWDYVYFEASTWVNHIAIASRKYDNWLRVYDSLKWEVKERFIKISWWNYYAWKYKVYVSEFNYWKKPKCKAKK